MSQSTNPTRGTLLPVAVAVRRLIAWVLVVLDEASSRLAVLVARTDTGRLPAAPARSVVGVPIPRLPSCRKRAASVAPLVPTCTSTASVLPTPEVERRLSVEVGVVPPMTIGLYAVPLLSRATVRHGVPAQL